MPSKRLGRDKESAVKVYKPGVFDPLLGTTLHPSRLELTARLGRIAGLRKNLKVLEIACGRRTPISDLRMLADGIFG